MNLKYLTCTILLIISAFKSLAQVTQISNFSPSIYTSSVSAMADINGTLFFSAWYGTIGPGDIGNELYKSTGGYPSLVKDIQPGQYGSEINAMTNLDGMAYFSASTTEFGDELWKSDGTADGTVLVMDINPGPQSSMQNINNSPKFINYKGQLFFLAEDGSHGMELWKSDGTMEGTTMVKDIFPGQYGSLKFPHFTISNNLLYFVANENGNLDQLWKTDGTLEGTQKISAEGADVDSDWDSELYNFKDKLYFVSSGSLWKTDGTTSGTSKIKSSFSFVGRPSFADDENYLIFTAYDKLHGYEIWKTDGTEIGTIMVSDIDSPDYSIPEHTSYLNGEFIFMVNAVNIDELWKTDGTTKGTTFVKTISYGTIYGFSIYHGKAYFDASNNDGYGYELWQTDGTASGTSMIKDLNPGKDDGYPENFCKSNDALFFIATDNRSKELYKISTPPVVASSYSGKQNELKIFPNPASEYVDIHFFDENKSTIKIFNSVGTTIYQNEYQHLEKSRIDMSQFPRGMYLMEVNYATNTFSQKIIVE